MIRFVDLRNQLIGNRFAWWSTSSDRFLEFDGDQAFETWDEFEEICLLSGHKHQLERFRGLTPQWAYEPEDWDRDQEPKEP